MRWYRTGPSAFPLLLGLVFATCNDHRQATTIVIDLTKLSQQNGFPPLPNRVEFTPVRSVTLLPESVKARIKADTGMADPGQRFNATDVVNSNLPMRRLIFAASSGSYYLLHYEVGGRGHSYVTVLFTLSGSQASPVWVSTAKGIRRRGGFQADDK